QRLCLAAKTPEVPMSNPYTPALLAEGHIRLAIARLLAKYPFHGRVLEGYQLLASAHVGTVGVVATPTGVQLLFDPDFVLKLPIAHLSGVLLREVWQVVLGQERIDPAAYRARWALTVALEAPVHEFVKEPLPEGVIRCEQSPMLPPMESFAERY